MKIQNDFTNDYVYEAVCFNQSISLREMNSTMYLMLEQAETVLEVLNKARNAGATVNSAIGQKLNNDGATSVVKAGKNVVTGGVNMIKKFIDFIKNMLGRFMDFIRAAYQNNEKWLKERKEYFATMNYKGLEITMVPYWDGKPLTVAQKINTDIVGLSNVYGLIDSMKEMNEKEMEVALQNTDPEEVFKAYETQGEYLDGIKNMMRVGNKDGKDAVTIREEDLKTKVLREFIPFVEGYSKLSADVEKLVNNNILLLGKIEATLTKREKEATVQETFLLMREVLSVSEASLSAEILQAVKEETEGADKPITSVEVKRDSTSGDTDASVGKRSKEEHTQDQLVAGQSTNMLKITRNVTKCFSTSLSCTLTVIEERYSVSINALKAIYKEANTRHGRKGNTEGKEEK